MKTTDNFKNSIQNHLNQLAEKDPLFAETLKKENKNIDGCITYILQTVQKSGCNGFEDSEIFGMAVHYYDEDSINVKGNINSNTKVVVNHVVELSEEEKAAARQKAIDDVIAQEKEKMTKKREVKNPVETSKAKPSLFDML
ncbi:PcfK-like family protein [Flavobacterium sp.]|uniref:PcfK-like family protein n=1 Tax=Flavobacterium sp. TaxID=239 RepID=UPI0025C051E9|nr:PcfK-like family protein [Flavobacterium sp.]MBA4155059.1 PcfK-like protein [Flavobacterium sp.]